MTQLTSVISIAHCDPTRHLVSRKAKGLLLSIQIKEALQVTISRKAWADLVFHR